VRRRLDDRAVLPLRRPGRKARIGDTDGQVVQAETGTPHGGTGAPVLAPVSLPSALDLWCAPGVQPHGRGEALGCREADAWGGACRVQADAARFVRVRPPRLGQCHRQGAPEQTHLRRCRRVPPRTKRRCPLLGWACGWRPARHGVPRVRRRTARQQRHAACPRLTAWSPHHRPRPGPACCQRLQARLRGHDNSEGVRGTARSLHRFCPWAMAWTCTWRNRRGGQQRRDTWEPLPHVLDRVKRGRPRMTEVPRRSVGACRLCLAPRKRVQPKNRMRNNCTSGTVRGVPGNRHSYRRDVYRIR